MTQFSAVPRLAGSLVAAVLVVGLLSMPGPDAADAASVGRHVSGAAPITPAPHPAPPPARRSTSAPAVPLPAPQEPAAVVVEHLRGAADAMPSGSDAGAPPVDHLSVRLDEVVVPPKTSTSTAPERHRRADAGPARRLAYDRSLIWSGLVALVVAGLGLLVVGNRRRLW